MLKWLDRAQVVILFAALAAHPTDFALDLGGERGQPQRHVFLSLGMLPRPSAQAKAAHVYVTAADVLLGAAFGLYALRRLIRRRWRELPPLPWPIALFLLWFVLSGILPLKPKGGREVTLHVRDFGKELIQTFEYLAAGWLLFEELFRDERRLRAGAVALMALATVVVGWAWVQYADTAGTPSVMDVSGPLGTRNSLGSTLSMMLPFALGVGLFGGSRLLAVWGVLLAAAGLGVTLSGGAFAAIGLGVLLVAFLRSRWAFAGAGAALSVGLALLCLFPALPRDNFGILQDSVLLFRKDDPYGVLKWMWRVPDKVKASEMAAERESWPWRQKCKEWQVALLMIGDSPLFGVGGGGFELNAGRYYNKTRYDARSMPKLEVDLMEPDGENFYLETAATLGLPALLLWAWVLADHARWAAAGLGRSGLRRGAAAGALGALLGLAAVGVFTGPLVRGVGVTSAIMLAMAASSGRGRAGPAEAEDAREGMPAGLPAATAAQAGGPGGARE